MVPFISTQRLDLYKVTEDFCNDTYLSWLHDQEVNKYLDSGKYPLSISDLISFVNHVPANAIFLAIVIRDSQKHIGNIKIDTIDFRNGRGEYGIMMGDKSEWGKGYAKEASIAIVEHCFERLNLRKITLGVVKDNVNAVELYKKIGFKQEGLLIKHSYCDGEFKDVVRMAIFNQNHMHHNK